MTDAVPTSDVIYLPPGHVAALAAAPSGDIGTWTSAQITAYLSAVASGHGITELPHAALGSALEAISTGSVMPTADATNALDQARLVLQNTWEDSLWRPASPLPTFWLSAMASSGWAIAMLGIQLSPEALSVTNARRKAVGLPQLVAS